MINKILPIILCLVLVFNISALATSSTHSANTNESAETEKVPMHDDGRDMHGGRGGMGMPPRGAMPDGATPPARPEGEMPPAMPEGEMAPPQDSENIADTTDDIANGNSNHMQKGGMNDAMSENTQNNAASETEAASGVLNLMKTYSTPITAVILLALAFVFVVFYKRKSY